jgi:hypothetical protein
MKEKMGVLLTCETQEMHTILQLENLKGRDYLEDLYIYKDNIKMDLKQLEYGYQDCTDLAQNRDTSDPC